jgi:hypothetical protein
MTNARPFSISTLQDLSNATKNIPMRGVLGLGFRVRHSGVPEDPKTPTLEVLGFTPTLGQSGVATLMIFPDTTSTKNDIVQIHAYTKDAWYMCLLGHIVGISLHIYKVEFAMCSNYCAPFVS